jgi:hypothetical protein
MRGCHKLLHFAWAGARIMVRHGFRETVALPLDTTAGPAPATASMSGRPSETLLGEDLIIVSSGSYQSIMAESASRGSTGISMVCSAALRLSSTCTCASPRSRLSTNKVARIIGQEGFGSPVYSVANGGGSQSAVRSAMGECHLGVVIRPRIFQIIGCVCGKNNVFH